MGARPAIPSQELDTPCVNTIRFLSVDAVENAKSGHPGMPMGAAPMAYVLWTRHLRHSPSNPRWFDRDRFVLSAGHASMLLYSLLHLTGYDLPLEELRRFRQWGSATPGHPELGRTPGVEVSTGPLGQGFGNGVGQAIAQRVPDLIGGSADLDPSTHTQLKGLGDFESQAAALGSAGAELQGESGVSRWRPALRSDGVAGSAIAGTSSASMASARRLRGRSFSGNTDST